MLWKEKNITPMLQFSLSFASDITNVIVKREGGRYTLLCVNKIL